MTLTCHETRPQLPLVIAAGQAHYERRRRARPTSDGHLADPTLREATKQIEAVPGK